MDIAAPIFGARGRVVAALSVVLIQSRSADGEIEEITAAVVEHTELFDFSCVRFV